MFLKTLILIVPCILLNISNAIPEIYQGIKPHYTLGVLKTLFPGATLKKLEPAWAQPEDVLYSIEGSGLSGTIVVKFYDDRLFWRKMSSSNNDSLGFLTKLSESPDDSVKVSWVKWVPDAPFPMIRLLNVYGKPDSTGYDATNYKPFRDWRKKGVIAYLTDDEKNVARIDYSFTYQEQYDSYVIQYYNTDSWKFYENNFFMIYPEAKGIIKRKLKK